MITVEYVAPRHRRIGGAAERLWMSRTSVPYDSSLCDSRKFCSARGAEARYGRAPNSFIDQTRFCSSNTPELTRRASRRR
jgi:hypothetical protein